MNTYMAALWQQISSEENEIIVSGYIRSYTKHENLAMSIPSAIIQVVCKFLHFVALTWDWTNPSYHQCPRSLQAVPNTINSIRGAQEMGTATVIAKNVISSKLYKRCYYEIEIESYDPKTISIFLGYVECKANGKYHFLQGLGCHENDHNEQFGAWISNEWTKGRSITPCTNNNWRHEAHGNLLNRPSIIKDEELSTSKWKNGDRIGIEINFKKNKSYIYCNDKFIGVFFEYLPEMVIPAVSIYNESTVLSVPTFKLFKKD